MSGRFFRCLGFFIFTLQIATKRGADERTRTALLVMAKDFWCEVKRKRSSWPCNWSDSVIR
jgi:hypothetical protein